MAGNFNLGDKWPYHYRGSKYHFNQRGDVWWAAPLKMLKVNCIEGHEKIVEDLLSFKKLGGSFRITENRDVITKLVEDDEGSADSYYIGKLDSDMYFEEVDINPKDINSGDLWPGFYEGSIYHFNIDGDIWWKAPYGTRWFANQDYSDLIDKLSKWKRRGGSFRINEYGRVITLLEKLPYPEHINEQMNKLKDIQKSIIKQKVESTELVPIYICDFKKAIEIAEPDIGKEWSEEETMDLIDKLKNMGR